MSAQSDSALLPPLREELELLPGPHTPEGTPTWTLHDPARNLFFQLDWPSFEILGRWHLKLPQVILEAIRSETCLQLDIDDVQAVIAFVANNQLARAAPGMARQLADTQAKRKGNWSKWLVHNYLFFRVPLVKPDRWLSHWAGRLDFFYSKRFFQLTLLAGIVGLVSIYREWEHYSSTLVDMFSPEGLLAYGLTLTGIKVLHELGHGFTAKRHGCRVPTMGVAFLVLWPVAYTDTNDVWRLTRRDQRLQVAAAGIATELIIAAWATLAWMWLPEGGLKTAAFLLSSTTWIMTLMINASPFLRFDGYFLLSDYLQISNLHGRAFALARWDLRERLFALGDPRPEFFPASKQLGLILFAWVTWLYRLILFLGIAAMVYFMFAKAIGIVLFAIEIVWFVALPMWQEVKVWISRWPQIQEHSRWRCSLAICLAGLVVFVIPWPSRVSTSGLLMPIHEQVIYAPPQAKITQSRVANNKLIQPAEQSMVFDSQTLKARAASMAARQESLAWQSAAAGFDDQNKKDWLILYEQFSAASAEMGSVTADELRYAPLSKLKGTVRDVMPDLSIGDWLVEDELVARIIGEGGYQIVAYLDDESLGRIEVGDRGLFLADGGFGPNFAARVASIDKDASRTLNEGELASMFGGSVLVREKQGQLYPERAVYRVVLDVSEPQQTQQHRWRGAIAIAGQWEPPGLRFLRYVVSVFWREAGF